MDKVNTILQVSDLCFSYNQHRVLSHLTFEIPAGSYTAIAGSNGSGKSTLARCIAGLLEPESGVVRVNGDTGIVFQSPSEQIVADIAQDDTAFGPCNLGLPSAEISGIVTSNLSLMSLLEYAEDETRTFSPGMKQRLVIAGILALSPGLLLFDESSSMIDPAGRKKLLDFIAALHKKGRTIIHITHDMEEARRAERVLVLHRGNLVFDGTAEDVFLSPSLNEWGLSLPDDRSCRDAVLSVFPAFDCPCESSPGDFAGAFRACAGNRRAALGSAATVPVEDKKPAVVLDTVSFSYENSHRPAVTGVSHIFYAGTVTAVAGKTGSGKSTLMQLAAGLIPPADGTVTAACTAGKPVFVSGTTVFPYCIQEPDAAVFCQFAGDDVAYGVRNQGYGGRELVQRTAAAMNTAGLPFKEFRDRPVYEMSGGERRKLGLAGILAIDSPVYFFDEPTMGLDPASRRAMLARMRTLADSGAAVVFSTHRLEEAAAADTVLCMEHGHIAFCGSPLEVFGDCRYTGELPWIVETAVLLSPWYTGRFPCCADDFAALARNIAAGAGAPAGEPQKTAAFAEYAGAEKQHTAKNAAAVPAAVRNFYPASKYLVLFALLLLAVTSRVDVLLTVIAAELCLLPALGLSCRRFFRTACTVLPFLLLVSLLQILLFPVDTAAQVYFQWHFFTLTSSSVTSVVRLFLHFFSMILPLWAFIMVMSRTELMDGITQLLSPLGRLGVPVEHAGLLCMMVFRFVPLLQESLERILIAQRSRGADIAGRRGSFFARVRRIIPVTVPLIICTLRKAELMAESVAVRRYGWARDRGANGKYSLRTSLHVYKIRFADVFFPALFLPVAVYVVFFM